MPAGRKDLARRSALFVMNNSLQRLYAPLDGQGLMHAVQGLRGHCAARHQRFQVVKDHPTPVVCHSVLHVYSSRGIFGRLQAEQR